LIPASSSYERNMAEWSEFSAIPGNLF